MSNPCPNSPKDGGAVTPRPVDSLAARGWTVLPNAGFADGTVVDSDAVRAIAGRFGTLSRRDGGTDLWPVRPRSGLAGATFSVRAGDAGLHTDAAYRPDPEDLIALFCVTPARDGGDTLLLDGRAALTSAHPSDVDEYRRPQWRWSLPEAFRDGRSATGSEPYPVLDTGGKVRWRADNLEIPDRLRGLAGRTAGRLASHPDVVRIRLAADSVLLCDNTRILHGRTGFTDVHRLLIRVRMVTR